MMLERLARVFLGRPSEPPPFAIYEPPPLHVPVVQSVKPEPEPAPAVAPAPAEPADDWTDRAPRRHVFDRVQHYRPIMKTVISIEKAVDLFIVWANDQGVAGLFVKDEIDDLWLTAQLELDIADIEPTFIRGAMAERGLRLGQVRMMAPQFTEVRCRTGKTRATLFRIPSLAAVAAHTPEITGQPLVNAALSPPGAVNSRQATGKPSATERRHAKPRKIAA